MANSENGAKINLKNAKTQKSGNNKEALHKNHRLRTFEKAAKDFSCLSPIEQVETMLFFILSRVDTNPLAHELLKRFGNYSSILDAEIADLMQVKGIGLRGAQKIRTYRNSIKFYFTSQINNNLSLKNQKHFLDVLEGLLRCQETENLYIFALTNSLKAKSYRVYDLKDIRQVGLPPLELYTFLASTNAAYLYFAHNHPGGSAMASDDDNNANAFIQSLIESSKCEVYDSVVVGEEGIFSKNHGGYLRHFDEETVFN